MMDGFDHITQGRAAVRDDFIPKADYVSPEMLRLEKEKMWPKIWQMACRVEEIPKVGDFVNYKIFDDSILVTRTDQDKIQAFYNTCQHRGRKLRDEEKGHAGQWYCRFHGWKYNLDGSIAYVHDRDDWAACPLKDEDLSLKEVKVGTWAGWVWINQDPDCVSLEEYLGDELMEVFAPFEWETGRMGWHETIIAPVNWKVVAEAFNESYHAHSTHINGWRNTGGHSRGVVHGRHGMFIPEADRAQLAGKSKPMEYLDPETGTWKTASKPSEAIWAFNRHIYRTLFAMTVDPLMAAAERLKDEAGPDYPPEQLMPRLMELHKDEFARRGIAWPKNLDQAALNRMGTDWHIFPNSIVLPTADSALWYRIRPNGDDPDSCVFDIWNIARYAPGQEPKVTRHETVGFEAFRGRNPFLEEDFDNMEAVHQGMKSKGWKGARTNPIQEIQTVNFHRVLHDYCYGDGWTG
jgi:phenylpropionate dioxygenase-like ring-hydroxylating dioxygenase large terminal subunit